MSISKLHSDGTTEAHLAAIVSALPPLPKIIRYEDDYDEIVRSVVVASSHDTLELVISGTSRSLDLLCYAEQVRPLVRYFLLYELLDLAPASVVLHFFGLRGFSANQIEKFTLMNPVDLTAIWPIVTNGKALDALTSAKAFLRFLCEVEVGAWSHQFRRLVRGLPVPWRDSFSVVRSGDCFLEIEEEASIVRWIDRAATMVATLSLEELQLASLVLCSYQFGMRPKQLGTLRKRDCDVRVSIEDGHPSVYLTFRTLKQKNILASRLTLLRKVKREWAQLVAATFKLLAGEDPSTFFFGFESRAALSSALIKQLDEILPGQGRDAYALRHSMVQRMVDAGANQEEVAAALGHTSLASGLVYFRASANQAELVNKALGLSETYQTVAKIATDRYISEEELALLKPGQQVAGVPHGIPIAGVGGCKTGQPLCPFNPVTSCYGCPKFMPVLNNGIHEQVLKELRGVVNAFRTAGAGDQESPAFLQLRRTIAEVQGVIAQLEDRNAQ